MHMPHPLCQAMEPEKKVTLSRRLLLIDLILITLHVQGADVLACFFVHLVVKILTLTSQLNAPFKRQILGLMAERRSYAQSTKGKAHVYF